MPSGFIYSTHNNLDAACTIGTNVELLKAGSDAPFVNGESLTLSFYIKSTSARSNVGISISTRDTAGGTGSVDRASGVTFNTTTGWTRVEKTFTLSGTVGGSNACLQFEFSLAIGDKVTGFQLEKNSFATDFEHRSYAQELALAQRYCQLVYVILYANGTGSNYSMTANTPFFTEMRSAPSASLVSADTTTNIDTSSYPPSAVSVNSRGVIIRTISTSTNANHYAATWKFESEL